MAIYSETLDDLVEKTCKLCLHDFRAGTATGGSNATVVDTNNRNEVDGFFTNLPYAEVYIRTTTDNLAPIGQRRDITTYVVGTVTVADVFTAAVGAGDTYSIHTEFPRDEVVEAINMAIDMVAEEALVWLVDETTIAALVAAQYEYPLPTTMMWLFKVTMADADGNFEDVDPIPSSQYHILHSAVPVLKLDLFPTGQKHEGHYFGQFWAESDLVAGRALRLEGMASPATLSSDTSTCPISPAYVAFQAAAMLFGSRITGNDVDANAARANYWQQRADIERARVVRVQLPAGAKRIRE